MEKNITIVINPERNKEKLSVTAGEGLINFFVPIFTSALLFFFIGFFSDGFLSLSDLGTGLLIGIIFVVMAEGLLSIPMSEKLEEQFRPMIIASVAMFCLILLVPLIGESKAYLNVFLRAVEIIADEDFLSRFIDYESLPDQKRTFEITAPFIVTYYLYCGFRLRTVSF
jgi:hypothetical protein